MDKESNVIEMIPKKKEKQDLDKYDLHLSEQIPKLFPEVENDSVNYFSQDNDNDQKINELPMSELTESLSKIGKGEVAKKLQFFEGGQDKKIEDKVKLIGLTADSMEFLEFLQSDFCQQILIENKLKNHIETGNVFFNNLDTDESIYVLFHQQENQ